ncbi:28S ribosomal protein S36, mitochondrial-like [Carassius auratus]|uniref:28S ribosomal protein S36, mitochondrial-like n=1 Tax=Carassius auratus TaxID=7957 RepID=A0A6P6MQL1_CARAU|nr:28S ribosomal protein S36, mitochondrial-like [Carassius auratus]XP_026098719.1 28S ribosomal protein S36, mitochondrial-like [Carassius auratus]
MGSKVSSKMAAVSRVVQVVRPHAPLIKFPDRNGIPRPNVQEALNVLAACLPQISPSAPPPPPTTSISPPPKPPGPIIRLPGTPDSTDVIRDLPQKYRRRTLALDEMDYIQRGGPE